MQLGYALVQTLCTTRSTLQINKGLGSTLKSIVKCHGRLHKSLDVSETAYFEKLERLSKRKALASCSLASKTYWPSLRKLSLCDVCLNEAAFCFACSE